MLPFDGEEEVLHVELEVEHLALPHVDLWDLEQNGVTDKLLDYQLRFELAERGGDVYCFDDQVKSKVAHAQEEGAAGVGELKRVENNLSHHVHAVADAVDTHVVDADVNYEVAHLKLKLGVGLNHIFSLA
eukprot:CAMPEP_0168614204 /NCGR_PEP_ID=MMETSP0449_2-20121227/3852_1 /TAXON_ID=1082188 /ORGANISM="Strombidium rassoulzadegani, Strain ras09" /LENGTH=129 /DNA_ID=CAMNT_0008654873 /DNA_START=220 /DNA_END=609 /DNA_ORIENTATION=+